MAKYKEDEVIGDPFNTVSIYRSGPNNFSENTHRGQCSIYLSILGVEMPWNKPEKCPWGEPGPEYSSSHDLQMQEREIQNDI